tara:strand:- start:248 stop:679 length:432 start_codon:yes stop_codon:yes gene_type:complete
VINKKILDEFKLIMKQKRLKITPQRVSILDELLKDKGHRESEEIYFAIKNSNSNVSRATVYRTLDILVEHNFIRKMNIGDGKYRYESKIDSHHHDHMICNYCNNIIEFVNSDIEDLQDKVAKTNNFILERHSLQLFGKCKDCQ